MPFDFEANATVESLDTVPAEFHPIYAKSADNKFTINPALKPLVDSYVGVSKAFATESKLKTTANKEAADRRLALKAINDFAEGLGLTVEEGSSITDVLGAHIADLTGKVKGGEAMRIDLEKMKKQFGKQIEEAVNAEKGNTNKMRSALEKHLINEAAIAALSGSGAVSPDLLMPHVRAQVKVVQNGDDFVAAVVDTDGTVRMNGKGSPMTVADLVSEMKTQPKYAVAFKSEARGGSGVKPKDTNTKVQKKDEELSPVENIMAGLANLGKK